MPVAILEKESVRSRTLSISLELYHELGRLGKIPEKTELLEGAVIEKMPKDPLHASVVSKIAAFFTRELEGDYMLRQENPLTFENSEPEPDLAVVDHRSDWYREAHPSHAHLIIEVSNTTLDLDREKALIYATAGIPEYWIVNLKNEALEVHTLPHQGAYGSKKVLDKREPVAPAFAPRLRFVLEEFI